MRVETLAGPRKGSVDVAVKVGMKNIFGWLFMVLEVDFTQ